MASNNNNKKYINSEGKEVLRVSHIIKTLAKDALMNWANYLGFKRVSYTKELDRTARVGTAVHDTIDDIVTIKTFFFHPSWRGIKDRQSADEYDNCMFSFVDWLYKNVWLQKNYIAHDLEIVGEDCGGTLDYVGWSPFTEGKVIIIDYKTSKYFTLSMFLQLAAYIILWESNRKEKIDGVMILKLDKSSARKAKTKYYTRQEMEIFIKLFKDLKKVALGLKNIKELSEYGDLK